MLNVIEIMGLLVNIAAFILAIYLSIIGKQPRIKKIVWLFTLLITIGMIIVYIIPPTEEPPEDFCSDDYLSISFLSKFNGPFYNPERYDLSVKVTNNQDKTILLSNIIAKFKNQDVFNKIEVYRELRDETHKESHNNMKVSSATTYFFSIYENPGVLAPKTSKIFNLMGPDLLPKEVELVISHSNSTEQSVCKYEGSYDKVEYQTPKHVNILEKGLGLDVLNYIQEAKHINSRLLSILPGNSETLIKENGLFVHNITEWTLYFIDKLNKGYIVRVNEEGIHQAGDYDSTEIHNIPNFNKSIDVKQVKVSMEKALMIVNNSNSIYGNSTNGWALLVGWDSNNKTTPIWRLPYIGKDYLNIFVNAENGEILPSKRFYKKYSPIRTISRTRFVEDNNR